MRIKEYFTNNRWKAWDEAALQAGAQYSRPSPSSSPRAELGIVTGGWEKVETPYGVEYTAPNHYPLLLIRAESREQFRSHGFVFQLDKRGDIVKDKQGRKLEDLATNDELGIWEQRLSVEVFFREMPQEPKSLVLWEAKVLASEDYKKRQSTVSKFLEDNEVPKEIVLNVEKYIEQEWQKRAERMEERLQEDAEVEMSPITRRGVLRQPLAPIREDAENSHVVRESSRRMRMMQNAQVPGGSHY